jgi:hypothetical protein
MFGIAIRKVRLDDDDAAYCIRVSGRSGGGIATRHPAPAFTPCLCL